ncbi:MAG: glycosyltransferase family 39 protein [Candidatus Aenigmatarchaeota archaeon]
MINKKTLEKIVIILILIFGIYLIYSASITPMLGEDEERIVYSKKFINGEIYPENLSESGQTLFFYAITGIPSLFFNNYLEILTLSHIFTAMFTVFLLFIIYFLGKKIENIYFSIVCTLFLLSFPLLFHLSLIAYVDAQIAFFSALIIYSIIRFDKNKTIENLIFLSIFSAISFYFKNSGVLLIFLTFCYLIYEYLKNKNIKFLLIFILITSSILLPHVIMNIIKFNYPNMPLLNYFFKYPIKEISWIKEATSTLSYAIPSIPFFINTFGFIQFILLIFAFILILQERKIEYILMLIFIILFILLFIESYIFGERILETRYLTIIFPQIAIINAYFVYELIKKKRIIEYFIVIIIFILLLFSLLNTFNTIDLTSKSIRYTPDYIAALKWIKENTNTYDKIFTVYAGALKIYGERSSVSIGEEFPELMRGTNSTYDYDVLKKYNVSYILIWSAFVGRDYIIPESNIIGAFTPTFINTMLQDTKHFEKVFENRETIIFKLL